MTAHLSILPAALVLTYLVTVPGGAAAAGPAPSTRKVGVLLINHGSRSETWRNALLQLEQATRARLLSSGQVAGVKTAFMEYTEPSIATRLKEFDAEGYSDVILVPVFLTVSSHTFDDIPTIAGQKEDPRSLETLKLERIERYQPRARTHLTPMLDFTSILQENVLRRVRALSKDPKNEGLVLIAYGDATYGVEWAALLEKTARYVEEKLGIDKHSVGYCGHVAHYDPAQTTRAIEQVLAGRKKALVVPVLVAHDEMFQIKIIGGGIAKVAQHEERVVYTPDSILPDENVEAWVVQITASFAERAARLALK